MRPEKAHGNFIRFESLCSLRRVLKKMLSLLMCTRHASTYLCHTVDPPLTWITGRKTGTLVRQNDATSLLPSIIKIGQTVLVFIDLESIVKVSGSTDGLTMDTGALPGSSSGIAGQNDIHA